MKTPYSKRILISSEGEVPLPLKKYDRFLGRKWDNPFGIRNVIEKAINHKNFRYYHGFNSIKGKGVKHKTFTKRRQRWINKIKWYESD